MRYTPSKTPSWTTFAVQLIRLKKSQEGARGTLSPIQTF